MQKVSSTCNKIVSTQNVIAHIREDMTFDFVGITISSSGRCSNRNIKSCTSLDQIRENTVSGIINLKRKSGCKIVVTGGTEV